VRQRRGWALGIGLLLAGIVAVGAARAAAAAAPDRGLLRADAGLGGLARPGRWAPVRVEIDNAARDVTGEIVLEWGDARVRRAVEIAAPSRMAVEVYIRTADARGSIAVRLVANGAALASVDVPVRIVPDGDPLVVCAGNVPAPADGAAPCTTTISPQALPQSMRGYVAADEVRLQPGAEAQLTPAQRTALQQWRAYAALNAGGLLAQAPRAPLAAANVTGTNRPAAFAATAAVIALLCAAAVWTRLGALQSYGALAAAILIGVFVAALAGRIGPGSVVRLQHATTVQQIAGGSIVTMRATVEYPAAGDFAIRVPRFDGELVARGASEQWLDAEGDPLHRGTFGRGERETVELDGVSDYAPFEVSVDGVTVRVSSRSNTTLTGCTFPEGFSATDAGSLAPGASVSAKSTAPAAASFFSCTAEPPVTFAEARFPVHAEGATVLSIMLPGPSPAPPVSE
jgi:hypothetical protein